MNEDFYDSDEFFSLLKEEHDRLSAKAQANNTDICTVINAELEEEKRRIENLVKPKIYVSTVDTKKNANPLTIKIAGKHRYSRTAAHLRSDTPETGVKIAVAAAGKSPSIIKITAATSKEKSTKLKLMKITPTIIE